MSRPIIRFDIQKTSYIYLIAAQDCLENPKCEYCGKALEYTQATHCSDECLFNSIKNSQPFISEAASKANSSTTDS